MTTAEDINLATIAEIVAQVVVSILGRLDTNTPRNESTTPRRARCEMYPQIIMMATNG